MAASRLLLHLLISKDAARAFTFAAAQQEGGHHMPVIVLSEEAADLVPPAGLGTRVIIDEPTRSPLADGSQKIDYAGLVDLIFEADSVVVW